MTVPQPPELLNTALALEAAGLCAIPAINDGTKAPHPGGAQWKKYQSIRSTPDQLRGWLSGTGWGLGVVGGRVSGGLVGLDVEGRAMDEGIWDAYLSLITASGLAPLLARVADGYTEVTASGGVHLLWRIDDGNGVPSTKLAKRPSTEAELAEKPDDKFKTLIETKSEGGFLILAPTAGTVHPDSKPWCLAKGGPTAIVTLTRDESNALLDVARMLDQVPTVTEPESPLPRAGTPIDGLRPGDDYENRTDWADILTPRGWDHISTSGGTRYWRRPGKKIGISATTGRAADRDRLYVFTTSSEFAECKPYTKFGAYALLEHGGDHTAAAKALCAAGYGTPTPLSPPAPKLSIVRETTPQMATDGATALATSAPRPTPTDFDPSRYGPTEDGLARAVVAAHRQQLRYCPQRGQWLTWEKHRWAWDTRELAREHVRDLARLLPDGDGWATFKKRALSASGVTGVLRLAQSDPCLTVHIDDLDARPHELNTPGGIVDLRTGLLRPPEAAALHTRCTAVPPDFDRAGEVFNAFLADTFAGTELAAFVQRILGVAAIGAVTEQILPFAHGEGANGKSTLIETVMAALATGETGYAIAAPAEMLMIRRHSEHPTEIAQLAGARLVVCSELEDGARFAESRIKQLTGRDSVNARFMRQDPFTFTPSHTLFLHGNHKPNTTAGGPAFWRRMMLIPFLNVVPADKRDGKLGEKLAQELPAILAWICNGAAAYSAHGLGVPELVTEATADYAHDQDSLGNFVEECCHRAPGQASVRVKAGALWAAYETWCRSAGENPITQKRFSVDLQNRFGVAAERTRAARFYSGITLLNDDEPVTDERYR